MLKIAAKEILRNTRKNTKRYEKDLNKFFFSYLFMKISCHFVVKFKCLRLNLLTQAGVKLPTFGSFRTWFSYMFAKMRIAVKH